jgi:hypothetical protein
VIGLAERLDGNGSGALILSAGGDGEISLLLFSRISRVLSPQSSTLKNIENEPSCSIQKLDVMDWKSKLQQ